MRDSIRFYGRAVAALKREKVPFMLGGAYALRHYTGIFRDTKDLDVFLRGDDVPAALRALALEGYKTELTDPLWLAKAFDPESEDFVDLIFGSGNGLCPVDDIWFNQSVQGIIYGQLVRIIPPEEMIWSKAFIMARDRFDGADIAHLILIKGREMDWNRLVWRFGSHWRVLFSHLLLFPFIYPGETDRIPKAVIQELTARAQNEIGFTDDSHACHGSLFDKVSYRVDSDEWGYFTGRKSA